MAEPVFDTQKAMKPRRDEAGFDQKAAEAMVEVLAEALKSVATKRDLGDLRAEMKHDNAQLRSDVAAQIAQSHAQMLRTMVTAIVGSITGLTAIFALIDKLF